LKFKNALKKKNIKGIYRDKNKSMKKKKLFEKKFAPVLINNLKHILQNFCSEEKLKYNCSKKDKRKGLLGMTKEFSFFPTMSFKSEDIYKSDENREFNTGKKNSLTKFNKICRKKGKAL